MVGFLVISAAANVITSSLTPFGTMFSHAFNISGVIPNNEAVVALAIDEFGTATALIMAFGMIANIIIARFTKFKYIFLTGQHNLFLSALVAILLKALGLGDIPTVFIGALIVGLASCLYPAIAQPFMRKVTGSDDIAIGHYCSLAYALSGWVGGKVGDPKQSTESLKLPGWLSIFKDYIVSITLSVGVFYYLAAIVAGRGAVEAISGGVHWLVYPAIMALTFTAGLYGIITGVRMFLGEIVPAFVGISEKFIPNAKPALDCPVVFPYAPTATVLGFISAYVAGLICMGIMAAMGGTVIIPVAIPYFFIGATAGVFGNATGGWKGCIVGAFLAGILIAVGPAIIYPIMTSVGLSGTSFPETDFNLIGIIFKLIGTVTGKF